MTYYELNITRGDRVEITKDILNFEGNRVLVKKGSQGTFEGGSIEVGRVLLDGKKRKIIKRIYPEFPHTCRKLCLRSLFTVFRELLIRIRKIELK